MKKLFEGWGGGILLLTILFASCSSSNSNIIGRDTDQQCRFLTQEEINPLPSGMQFISEQNADGTFQVCDSLYTVEPSGHERILLMKQEGTFKWLILLPILGILVIVFGQFLLGKSIGGYAGVILTFIGILVVGGGPASVWWADTKTATISKSVYTSELADHGNLTYWWETEGNLYK